MAIKMDTIKKKKLQKTSVKKDGEQLEPCVPLVGALSGAATTGNVW
jgi:hypothetical protein